MSAEPLQFTIPVVGRLTTGSVSVKRDKDQDSRPIPEDNQRYEFGVAYPKAEIWNWMTTQMHPYLQGALAQDTNALQRMQNWFQTMSGFSMKIGDGDTPNSKGEYNENNRGCFVFYFSAIEPKCVAGPDHTKLVEIDSDKVKRGFYVQVAGNLKSNGQPGDRAGIYLNGNVVWLRAEGEVIAGGIDATSAFDSSADAAQLPAGAQPYDPSQGAAAQMPGMPQGQPPQGMPQGQPPQGMPQGQPPQGMPNAPDQPQTGHAGMPGVGGVQQPAPGQTASPSEPQTQPYPGFLSGPPSS